MLRKLDYDFIKLIQEDEELEKSFECTEYMTVWIYRNGSIKAWFYSKFLNIYIYVQIYSVSWFTKLEVSYDSSG